MSMALVGLNLRGSWQNPSKKKEEIPHGVWFFRQKPENKEVSMGR